MITKSAIQSAISAGLLGYVALSASAQTGNLQPGDVGYIPTGTIISGTLLASKIINYSAVNSINGKISIQGTLLSEVINEGANNPLGGLTFLYQISNSGPNVVENIQTNDFSNFETNVFYDASSGIVAPNTASRGDENGDGSLSGGDFVRFNFGSPALSKNTVSDFLVIETNALSYSTNLAGISDGLTANVDTFGSSFAGSNMPAAPEPSGWVLLAFTGLVLSLKLIRARKTCHISL